MHVYVIINVCVVCLCVCVLASDNPADIHITLSGSDHMPWQGCGHVTTESCYHITKFLKAPELRLSGPLVPLLKTPWPSTNGGILKYYSGAFITVTSTDAAPTAAIATAITTYLRLMCKLGLWLLFQSQLIKQFFFSIDQVYQM